MKAIQMSCLLYFVSLHAQVFVGGGYYRDIKKMHRRLLLLFLRARVQPTLDPYAEAFL